MKMKSNYDSFGNRVLPSWFQWLIAYATIFGYWFNLPLITTHLFGGYNEFRVYDVTFAFLTIYMLLKKDAGNCLLQFLRKDDVLKHLYRFSLWASVMIIPTVGTALMTDRVRYIGASVIFLYHLWGFLLFAGMIGVYFQGKDGHHLLRWFLTLSTAHLFLYYSQVAGAVGNLWPKVYQSAYGADALSGTLGPNRITPGMMTLFGLVAGLFVVLKPVKGRLIQPIAWVNIVMALPAIIMIGSRTTFVSLLTFVGAYVLFYSKKSVVALLVIVPLFGFAYVHFLGDAYNERVVRNIEYNENKLTQGQDLGDLSIVEGYENIGSNRMEILRRYVPFLLTHPYIIPFGTGFNNRLIAARTGAASAHNIYLSLINELGVVGLYLYLSWFWAYITIGSRNRRIGISRSTEGLMSSLALAMLFSMFAGEHIYVYRPLFAIMGTFLLVMQFMKNSIEWDWRVRWPPVVRSRQEVKVPRSFGISQEGD